MELSISGGLSASVTIVSNQFIDQVLPLASGVCVKVYLYLLRNLTMSQETDLSISSIAAYLGESESDVQCAIAWLEQHMLLQVAGLNDSDLSGVSSAIVATDVTAATNRTTTEGFVSNSIKEEAVSVAELPNYSKAQIEKLASNNEVKWIMSIAERYLERLLTPADIQLIIYLYETIGFSSELILYLYEYCASRDKKNPAYIEKVALNWAEEGIQTVEQAEAASVQYHAYYQSVAKAFGMNRMPGAAEQRYIDHWTKTLGFSTELIEEACSRSLLLTHQPDFKYANQILENWYKKGITTKQEIAQADQLHSQNAARTTFTKTNLPSKTNNRFNAFPQRNYSGEEYASLEQRLLHRNGN